MSSHPIELRVLLIEGRKCDAETIMGYLRPANGHSFDVVWDRSVEHAIKHLVTDRYNVIILDLCGGDCDNCPGIEPLVRLNGEVFSTPVVVITQKPDETLGYQAIQLGAQEHLSKIGMTQEMLRKAVVHAYERHKLLDSLRTDSITDELTGLNNRRGFSLLARQALKTAKRTQVAASLLFIDMDNLKTINDKHGHEAGDEAIKTLSLAIKDTFRESDTIARLGGDEFAIFAVKADKATCEGLVQRLKDLLKNREIQGRPWQVTISAGIASFGPDTSHDIQDMLMLADALMYEEKVGKKRRDSSSKILDVARNLI